MAGGSDSSSRSTVKPRRVAKVAPARPTAPAKGDRAAKAEPAAKAAGAAKTPGRNERRTQLRVRSRSLANGGIAGDATRKAAAFLGTTINLSSGGCLIRTYEALESGMTVTITLRLPEGELGVQGTVVHVNEDAVGCKMVGVRFTPLPPDAHTMLVQHIASFGVDSTPDPADDGKFAASDKTSGKFVIEGRIHRR